MSTSLLYHAFNIKGVEYHSTKYLGNAIVFSTEITNKFLKCPRCDCRQAVFKGQKTRWLKMGPLGRKQALLRLRVHRLQCVKCEKLWWPQLPFMVGKHRYTRSFTMIALDLLRFGTIKDVAQYLHVGWDLLKEIHKSKLHNLYRNIPLKGLKFLGIDEFSIRKGHKYMTIFIDLQSGRILHAVEGRSQENIQPFLKKSARKAKKLKAVAMDMSRSFSSAVTEHLPKADIVFDRYHIMANINMAIEGLRREQQRTLDDKDKAAFKGCRFVLLRNYHALTENNEVKLTRLFEINKPLFKMHSMKEQLRLLWSQPSRKHAVAFFLQWWSYS